MFGEAKFTNSLIEGIRQIQDSLGEYENKLNSEFMFMTSVLPSSTNNPLIKQIFERASTSINMREFLNMAGFKIIGIPLFICHGQETSEQDILKQLKKIKHPDTIIGFKVKYICISLPISNKEQFIKEFTETMKERADEYDGFRK